MQPTLDCPACQATDLDLATYESLMAITAKHALFTLRCPHCGARVSGLREIPPALLEEVRFAAIEVGAGMGGSL